MTWPLSQVFVEHTASTLPADAGIEDLVDATWARQQSRAAARGMALTDAVAYRLERYDASPDRLTLVLALVDYRRHSALKEVHDRVAPEHHDRALVADALVVTADGCVALLRTVKPVGTELQLVGGTATPSQRGIVDTEDLAQFTRDRVHRALPGCGEVDVRGVHGVVEQAIGCRSVVMDVHVAARSAELRAAEGNELVLVPRDELATYLSSAPGYLPDVVGVL